VGVFFLNTVYIGHCVSVKTKCTAKKYSTVFVIDQLN